MSACRLVCAHDCNLQTLRFQDFDMISFPHKNKSAMLVGSCAVVLAALGIFTVKSQAAGDKPAAQPKPALTVTVAQAEQVQLPVKLGANGNIAAWQEASIGSEANGLRLLEVRAGVGDVVRAGQVLAVFGAQTILADVAQARASLMEAQANAQEAAGNAERARTLKTTGALSEQQINQYQTAEQTAKARVEAAKASLEVQQQRLKHTRVLAPDSGIISMRSATVGAVPGSGVELFRLIRKGRLEWRAEVTSAELARIAVGTPATVTSVGGQQVKGRVRMIAPTVDPLTRAALVYVDLPPLPMANGASRQISAGPPQGNLAPSGGSAVREATSVGALLPGMFAKGEFELGSSGALTVPQTSVVVREGFTYVYKLGADSRVSRSKVQTGRALGERIEIVSGLDAGVRIVAMGAGFLNEGDLVRVVEGARAPALQSPAAPAANPVASATR